MRLLFLIGLAHARISRGKVCSLENGMLLEIADQKNQFTPVCNEGFRLSEELDLVKCKKGNLVPEIQCLSKTVTTSTTPARFEEECYILRFRCKIFRPEFLSNMTVFLQG